MGLRRGFGFNNIDVASLIQPLTDPVVILILVRVSVSLYKLRWLDPHQDLFNKVFLSEYQLIPHQD